MRIDRLALAIRPRTPFEASDLGGRLLLRNARAVYLPWLTLMVPLLLLSSWLLERTQGDFPALLLLWWLKPLFDYQTQWILSQAVFGERPTLLASLGALLRLPARGLPGALLSRRLSMSRSFVLPVRLLEELPGRELDARIGLIRRGQTGRARWVMQVHVLAELSVLASLLSLIGWFSPAFSNGLDLVLRILRASPGGWEQHLLLWLYALAVTLIEPFYAAAGFLLYLNRRSELEAWDIEIAFRQMAERLRQQTGESP